MRHGAAVLAAVRFAGGTSAAGLLETVEILRELDATGAPRVGDEAPDGFVPTRWRGYLDTARKSETPAATGTTKSCAPCSGFTTDCAA